MAAIRTYDATTIGSQEVLAVVKKRQKPAMILFCVLSGILLLLGIIGFVIENYVLVVIAMFFILPFLIPAIIFIVRYTHPMKCRPLKKNPVVLQQADWMFRNITFQNDLVVVSPNFFAPKTDISAIVPVQEVLLTYNHHVFLGYRYGTGNDADPVSEEAGGIGGSERGYHHSAVPAHPCRT